MTTLTKLQFLGAIKVAEMELSEAAFKAGDCQDATAAACLLKASEAIGKAMELMRK